jgi:cyclopropane-fatty-acyl-phospholipid synthase
MSGARQPARGGAGLIADLVRTHAGLDLPVRLRAWDGSEAGPAEGLVLTARSPRALRRILWCPGELGLARAYISGDLDVDGDLSDGLRRVLATLRTKPGGSSLATRTTTALAAACGGTPGTRTISATSACGGACSSPAPARGGSCQL